VAAFAGGFVLVLLGPPFQGTDAEYASLAQATGLLAYDLRSRIKPGLWGVVRPLGNPREASVLLHELRARGFRAVAVDPAVGGDAERAIASVRSVELGPRELRLRFQEREMIVPYSAIVTVVRGEVHLGQRPAVRPPSTPSFRAVVPGSDTYRELGSTAEFDAYAALDLHFFTVPWVARIAARAFDFSILPAPTGNPAADLDALADLLGQRSGARVDRGQRSSSVASFAEPRSAARKLTPVPGSLSASVRPVQTDERFDAYSRLIAEAERLVAQA
jgi:hypothetical protein